MINKWVKPPSLNQQLNECKTPTLPLTTLITNFSISEEDQETKSKKSLNWENLDDNNA